MIKSQAGDIIMVKPKGLMFKFIRWHTQGKFGHIGMIAGHIQKHTLIVEANRNGIDLNDLEWRHVYKENYAIYRFKDLTKVERKELAEKALIFIGKAYDKMALLNFVIGKTIFGSDKNLYCSELIYRILIECKILKKSYNPERISPAKLFKLIEKKLDFIGEVEFK